ncbi:hypothetical protein [Methanolobus sp. ZRKC5]
MHKLYDMQPGERYFCETCGFEMEIIDRGDTSCDDITVCPCCSKQFKLRD